jgi:hypothetical protein
MPLAALNLGVKAVDGVSGLSVWLHQKNKEQDAGRLYDKVQELMIKRTVLAPIPVVALSQTQNADPVKSPIVESLINLFIGKDEKNLHHTTKKGMERAMQVGLSCKTFTTLLAVAETSRGKCSQAIHCKKISQMLFATNLAQHALRVGSIYCSLRCILQLEEITLQF